MDKGEQRLAADLLQLMMQLDGSDPTSEHFFTKEAGRVARSNNCASLLCVLRQSG